MTTSPFQPSKPMAPTQGAQPMMPVEGHVPTGQRVLPPSVQKVLMALQGQGPRTNAQIRDATNLPRRTVYAALQRLKAEGLLHERVSLKDTRQTYFWVDPVAAGEASVETAA